MILTKSPIALHDPAGPTSWSVLVLRFLRGLMFPRPSLVPAIEIPLSLSHARKPEQRFGCITPIACSALLVLSCSCSQPNVANWRASNTYLLTKEPRPPSLPPDAPVTLYVGGSPFAGLNLDAPVRQEKPPKSLHLVAILEVTGPRLMEDNKRDDKFRDPEHPYPKLAKIAVAQARGSARALGCNTLFVKSSTAHRYELVGLFDFDKSNVKTYRYVFVAGTTR